jgi:uncharacterized protein (DUF1330 family)
MKTRYTVALSMFAGAALGGAAIQGLHAQARSPVVYYVGEVNVTNSDAYAKEYAPKALALIKKHGGRFLALGGSGGASVKITALEGDPPKRAAIQVWGSMEKLQAWRNDPEFKKIRNVGNQYATFRAYAIESLTQ